jgi:ribosome modulation factor
VDADDRKPVSCIAELKTLDERDVLHGYLAGLAGGRDELGPEFNRSYWHGWCNGRRDKYRMQPTAESAKLGAGRNRKRESKPPNQRREAMEMYQRTQDDRDKVA